MLVDVAPAGSPTLDATLSHIGARRQEVAGEREACGGLTSASGDTQRRSHHRGTCAQSKTKQVQPKMFSCFLPWWCAGGRKRHSCTPRVAQGTGRCGVGWPLTDWREGAGNSTVSGGEGYDWRTWGGRCSVTTPAPSIVDNRYKYPAAHRQLTAVTKIVDPAAKILSFYTEIRVVVFFSRLRPRKTPCCAGNLGATLLTVH